MVSHRQARSLRREADRPIHPGLSRDRPPPSRRTVLGGGRGGLPASRRVGSSRAPFRTLLILVEDGADGPHHRIVVARRGSLRGRRGQPEVLLDATVLLPPLELVVQVD